MNLLVRIGVPVVDSGGRVVFPVDFVVSEDINVEVNCNCVELELLLMFALMVVRQMYVEFKIEKIVSVQQSWQIDVLESIQICFQVRKLGNMWFENLETKRIIMLCKFWSFLKSYIQ